MTTFQDPPPQSRRAVRQSERGETPDQSAAQPPYSFDQAADAPEPQQDAAPQQGRRAQPQDAPVTADVPQPGFEPLTYVTQGRVPLPQDAAPAAETVAASQPPVEQRQAPPPTDDYSQDSLAAQPPPGAAEAPAYRVRDFSPEGRRSAINREQFQNVSQGPAPVSQAPAPAMAPPVAPTPTPTAPVDLEYHTQGVAHLGSHAAPPQQAVDEATMNHTLTRRELRELRAAQEAEAPALRLPEPIDALLNSGPIELPTLAPPPGQSQALAEAMAEFDLLTRARREAEAQARDAQVASLQAPAVSPEPVAVEAVQQEAVQPEPVEPEPIQAEPIQAEPVQVVPALVEPAPPPMTAPVPLPPPFDIEPLYATPSAPEAAAPQAPEAVETFPQTPPSAIGAPADPVFLEPEKAPSRRPTGHWSVQAESTDDDLPFENTLSRTVGTGTSAITTSALVLPSVPQASDLTRPLNSTGEILVTGSIDLPRSLGSTGAHPHRVDNSDYEDDPLDSQVSSPDSAPVRAIRAVSTHTSTRGVIESKRPQSNRLLTGIIIAASVLVVGVVGLLVFAFINHQL